MKNTITPIICAAFAATSLCSCSWLKSEPEEHARIIGVTPAYSIPAPLPAPVVKKKVQRQAVVAAPVQPKPARPTVSQNRPEVRPAITPTQQRPKVKPAVAPVPTQQRPKVKPAVTPAPVQQHPVIIPQRSVTPPCYTPTRPVIMPGQRVYSSAPVA